MCGFTLIELLVVVAIIGTLAAIAIPAYNNYIDTAKRTIAISTMDTVRKTFESFHIDYQLYPTAPLDMLNGTDSSGRSIFTGTLLEQIKNDIVFVSYNSVTGSYTFKAEAKNKERTLITLTPAAITY